MTDSSIELNNIRSALDQSAIVAITDRAGNIIHVNDRFCQISKYPREDLIGKNHRIINSGYHRPDFFVELWKTISSGRVWEGEICNRASDGSHYWVDTTIVPFLDEAGQIYQYVSIRFEITARKKADEQLRVYADQLERSNRELQDFASIAAHDLQEPLRKIQTFGDRLSTSFGASLPEDGRDYLRRMVDSAKRMRRLIDDLLTYSRVGTQGKEFVPVDLNGILTQVLSDLELRIEQTHAQIDFGEMPTVIADPSQMGQLFLNLILNALKFHKKDAVPRVTLMASRDGDFEVIRVKDDGIGFDMKYLDRIFTIFQRLHGRHEYEGTGVGLAVCRRIVERHHGTITAVSDLGHGAEFVIRLPVSGVELL